MKVEISNGELIDKIAVLRVKMQKIDDPEKRTRIKTELAALEPLARETPGYDDYVERLEEINARLWVAIANTKRLLHDGDIGDKFTSDAINTIAYNDRRYLIKKEIDRHTDSEIREVKDDL